MAKAWGGSHPHYTTRVSPIRRQPDIPIDEARLRPHLRTMQPTRYQAPDTTDIGTQGFAATTTTASRIYKPEPGDLRGIPAIGEGVPGCQPGTHPEHTTIQRLTRQQQIAS